MKSYLVMQPAGSGRDSTVVGRIVFLRESFRWLALFFAPLWMLWHRLWLALAGWLLAVVTLSMIVYGLGLEPRATAPVLWLPTLFVAFEGSELLRRKLVRRGYREVAVIVADDIEEAEQRFFADWKSSGTPVGRSASSSQVDALPSAPAATPSAALRPHRVVGLFPESGGPR